MPINGQQVDIEVIGYDDENDSDDSAYLILLHISGETRFIMIHTAQQERTKQMQPTCDSDSTTSSSVNDVSPHQTMVTSTAPGAIEVDGGVSFADIGGLGEQLKTIRELLELPLLYPQAVTHYGLKVCIFCER